MGKDQLLKTLPYLLVGSKNKQARCGGTVLILALGKMRQENYKFEASLGYIVRSCLKTKTKTKYPPKK
jgi:hypothetical protein